MKGKFDAAVIGLGAVGASALWHLSRTGKRVAGFDQFDPPHDLGSTHGETRITRLAVGEGGSLVPLVRRSHELWREIERVSGKVIMTTTGGLLMDSGGEGWSKYGSEGFLQRTVRIAREARIPHEVFDAGEVRRRFREFNLEAAGTAFYEPSAGLLRPELAVATQLAMAEENRAVIRRRTKVLGLERLAGGGVAIRTDQGHFEAGRVLVSAGAWVKEFLPVVPASHFKVCRQILHWIPRQGNAYEFGRTPVYMWGFGRAAEDFIYGFPSLDGATVKLASESFVESPHPDAIAREVAAAEQADFIRMKVAGHFNHVELRVVQSKVCLYTMTPDSGFVLDEMPGQPEVLVASACSGHGFKHSAAIGEAMAARLLGEQPRVDLGAFRFPRPAS